MEDGESISHLGHHSIKDFLRSEVDWAARKVALDGPPIRLFEIQITPIAKESEPGGWVLMMRGMTQEQEVQFRTHLQDRLAVMGHLVAVSPTISTTCSRSFWDLLKSCDMNPKIPESEKSKLRLIHSQELRAEQLIRQVLDFSRQSKSVQQPIDLVSFVKESAKMLERALPENIDLVVNITSESHVVNANLTQIQQVVINLAGNAHDAMPDGGQLRIALS